jgi:uncharacterized membrane protein YadS
VEAIVNRKTLFFVALILSASGLISPSFAPGIGLVYGLSGPHPYLADGRILSKFLLQASVVALGFGMNQNQVLRAGRGGFVYTAAGIAFVLMVGWSAGRLLRVPGIPSFLVSVGTAKCGASAIAAIAPIVQADEEETAISLGTIFVLNALALLIFPAIGWAAPNAATVRLVGGASHS